MPKYITHWILAEEAFQALDDQSAFKQIIAGAKTSYLIGSVIPDAPFYLVYGRDGRVMNGIAESIHNARKNSFRPVEAVAAAYAEEMSDPVTALLLGMITHIFADAVFHPAVYYFSGPPSGNSKSRHQSAERHHILETYLNLYLRNRFQVPHRGKFSAYLKHLEIEIPVFYEIIACFFSVSGPHGLRMIKKSIRMNAAIQSRFDKRWPRLALDCLNLLPGVDLAQFIGHFYPYLKPDPDDLFQRELAFRHPVTGESMLFSVERFMEKTVQKVLEVFYDLTEIYEKKNSLPAALHQMRGPNLYTGLNGYGKSDMVFFDNSIDIKALIRGDF